MNDFLYIDSWQKLVTELDDPRLVYCHTEHAPEVFERVRGTGKPIILVSGHSDYTVTRQADHHPNADLGLLAECTEWDKACAVRDRYLNVMVGPACEPTRCNNSHLYSLKTDRFTWQTFDEPPREIVRWFTTNLNLTHPRMELLPFGLNTDGPGSGMIPDFVGRPKTGGLYLNFQINSVERLRLKQHYRRAGPGWLTYRDEPNLPVRDYLSELSSHAFALCPAGCGLDSYRLWECLYLGVIPILPQSAFSEALVNGGLRVAAVNNLYALDQRVLSGIEHALATQSHSLEMASLSYWRAKFLRQLEEMG